jgi:hypothetical protein
MVRRAVSQKSAEISKVITASIIMAIRVMEGSMYL